MTRAIDIAAPAPAVDVWADAVWPWLSTWLHSPGFAGAAALIAGCIFYAITTWDTARLERQRRRATLAAVERISARNRSARRAAQNDDRTTDE